MRCDESKVSVQQMDRCGECGVETDPRRRFVRDRQNVCKVCFVRSYYEQDDRWLIPACIVWICICLSLSVFIWL